MNGAGQGWLEGYLLTGRHGLFNCYEAFVRIVDSMFSQHATWLKACCRCSTNACAVGTTYNVIVAGKHVLPQWLTMEAAVIHYTPSLGIWQWASKTTRTILKAGSRT